MAPGCLVKCIRTPPPSSSYPGALERILECPPTCLDSNDLAFLKEAFPWHATHAHPSINMIKLEAGLVAKTDVLPLGDGQIPPPLCLRQAHSAMIGSQWGLPQGPMSTVDPGHKSIVVASPDSIQVSLPLNQSTCTFRAVLSDPP